MFWLVLFSSFITSSLCLAIFRTESPRGLISRKICRNFSNVKRIGHQGATYIVHSMIYGAYNPISQNRFERGDFHVAWYAFVLPNSHFRANSFFLIFSSKGWLRVSFYLKWLTWLVFDSSFYRIHKFEPKSVRICEIGKTSDNLNLWNW